ncbi:MAG: hypothetical protein VX740_06260 [Pseudomonadota bacterium]|jgi:hypothetical protein|nr:hypothetical protein [Pseudomonadota bacterium]MED5423024.1 hypothetical protein [Pseudomonadota bacterium]
MLCLQNNFHGRLAAAYQADFTEAAAREAVRLAPYFAALGSEGRLSEIFKAVALDNGSLIDSRFIVTDSASFLDYAHNDCAPYYNGDRHTVYPAPSVVTHHHKTGFAQILRLKDDTRISQPVLSLDARKLTPHCANQKEKVYKGLERLYSQTTHDWLHHLTMATVNNDLVVKANRHRAVNKALAAWNEKLPMPNAAYPHTTYEAWALTTHAGLVHDDRALLANLKDTVTSLAQDINDWRMFIFELPDKDLPAALEEWAYVHYVACQGLLVIAAPEDELFAPLATLAPTAPPNAISTLFDLKQTPQRYRDDIRKMTQQACEILAVHYQL